MFSNRVSTEHFNTGGYVLLNLNGNHFVWHGELGELWVSRALFRGVRYVSSLSNEKSSYKR